MKSTETSVVTLCLALVLTGCAHNEPPPPIHYDEAAFLPAHAAPIAVPVPAPIMVSEALPLDLAQPAARNPVPPQSRVARADAQALQEPRSDTYLNAMQVYAFSDGALYHVYTAPYQVSDIVLERGEVLNAISAGDTVRWAVGDTASGSGVDRQVHVMVKPFAAGFKTNLVILTDKRTYHLLLESTKSVAMAAVSWTYPAENLIAARQEAEAEPISAGIALGSLNFRYAISGDRPPWRPLRAFDDGHKVYIEFPARIDQGETPPLFVVGRAGDSELVNYRVKDNYYIVDRLFAAAELRLGTDKQQIVRITRSDTKTGGAP